MARVKLSPLVDGASGQVGSVVFTRRRGTAVVRRAVDQVKPQTDAQQAGREHFAAVVRQWDDLEPARDLRSTWEWEADDQVQSGRNAFIGANVAQLAAPGDRKRLILGGRRDAVPFEFDMTVATAVRGQVSVSFSEAGQLPDPYLYVRAGVVLSRRGLIGVDPTPRLRVYETRYAFGDFFFHTFYDTERTQLDIYGYVVYRRAGEPGAFTGVIRRVTRRGR